MSSKITPCLWYDHTGEEAANFHVSLLPDSRIDRIMRSPTDTPSGPAWVRDVFHAAWSTISATPCAAMFPMFAVPIGVREAKGSKGSDESLVQQSGT
jgi:predicted 3-demethylubiquinone-9 3-methyltransferase (glyoxalase superfamily)